MARVKEGFGILKTTFTEFSNDDCPRMAAALAYYTVFSLPPLLVLIILLAGSIWGQQAIQGQIETQIADLIGPQAADQVQTMIRSASEKLAESGGLVATLLGLGALLFGATGAFAQLQGALNQAWEVEPDPEAGGLKNFVFKRLLSFGMILGVAFLLLVSLVVSAVISVVLAHAQELLPQGISGVLLWAVNTALTFGIITLLFAALFKILPDADIDWRDVWAGAAVTALLFTAGKFLLSFYLGRSDPGGAFGAAGSLAIILVWIYYSSMILLLGAEFTQVWVRHHGKEIRPAKGAVRFVTERRPLADHERHHGKRPLEEGREKEPEEKRREAPARREELPGRTPDERGTTGAPAPHGAQDASGDPSSLPEPHNRVDRVFDRDA